MDIVCKNKDDNHTEKRIRARQKHGSLKCYKKLIDSERVNRGALCDFKINFTGSFVYINNGGISEYTLNSYKEYISINLW